MRIIDVIKTFKVIDSEHQIVSICGYSIIGDFKGYTSSLISAISNKVKNSPVKNDDTYFRVHILHDTSENPNFTNLLFFKEFICIHKKDYCEIFPLDEMGAEDISFLVLKYGKVLLEEGYIKCV